MSKTNVDRIREMSVDELAGIIMCPYDVEPEHCVGPGKCIACCKKMVGKRGRGMMYECMKDFALEKYDEDGFPTDEYMAVMKGSKWERDDSTNIIGGVHLESVGGSQWIEISKKTLNECFREVTVTNGKIGGF